MRPMEEMVRELRVLSIPSDPQLKAHSLWSWILAGPQTISIYSSMSLFRWETPGKHSLSHMHLHMSYLRLGCTPHSYFPPNQGSGSVSEAEPVMKWSPSKAKIPLPENTVAYWDDAELRQTKILILISSVWHWANYPVSLNLFPCTCR